ncbi:MAG: mycothiol synthase [Actinomycetia bacterium]|nr:mycothiol synthase [Actinomycetes bacterium]
MVPSRTPEVLATPDRQAVQEFLSRIHPVGCARLSSLPPVGDSTSEAAAARDSAIVGYAHIEAGDDGYIVDCVAADPATRELLVTTLVAGIPATAAVTWWGHDQPSDAALAVSLQMNSPYRRLLNMRRPLPLEPALATSAAHDVSVRPFVVGSDDLEWLRVNNAAFSWHEEQSDWDLATLRSRINEPWFDPAGFLLHERDGRLAAFCWTKVHETEGASRVGEIYVIAVHPDFHGLGLGRALTIAGLRHLGDTGSTTAMLYVEADNTAAVRLYESLGFQTAHTDVAYHRPKPGAV